MKNYTVTRGDTLYGISKQFDVPVETIKRVNNLTSNTITVGQVLSIPTNTTTATYTVKAGDTLYKIANQYNTTVQELIELNNLSSNILSIGQQLKVPVEGTNNQPDSNYITYTVVKGDNLYSIANKYGVTVETIKQANNLTSNLLSIGQILKIPTQNIETGYKEYEVKAGDSLYSIARSYNTTVEVIVNANNLTTTILSVGQILKIPTEKEETTPGPVKECFGEGYVEPKYETYTVKRGDNLYDIARRYNTTVIDLMNLNNLTSTNLEIGQVLKVREL